MLIKCPECDLQASDKALQCPHCGLPFQKETPRKYQKRKRMRLPNGFGQITELKNRRLRKPFRAMVTVGKNEFGKPIQKLLKPEAYFETYNQAYEALVEYNKNPYDLDDDITIEELYNRWTEEYFKKIKTASQRPIRASWAYCRSIYKMRAKDLRPRHIKEVMENGTAEVRGVVKHASADTKSRIKSMFNLMYDYALEYELVNINYARAFDVPDEVLAEQKKSYKPHIPFTYPEMQLLWENINFPYVNVVLLQCYSGWRPQELGNLLVDDVDLNKWVFKGGMKTESGTDRTVPIHEDIRPIVKKLYDQALSLGSEYLICCPDGTTHCNSTKFTYDKYKTRFATIRGALNLNSEHRPHDCRSTFATMCKSAHVDEYAIKYMMGHKISDITESIYTRRTHVWLHEEIKKIGREIPYELTDLSDII